MTKYFTFNSERYSKQKQDERKWFQLRRSKQPSKLREELKPILMELDKAIIAADKQAVFEKSFAARQVYFDLTEYVSDLKGMIKESELD